MAGCDGMDGMGQGSREGAVVARTLDRLDMVVVAAAGGWMVMVGAWGVVIKSGIMGIEPLRTFSLAPHPMSTVAHSSTRLQTQRGEGVGTLVPLPLPALSYPL